MFWLKKDSDTRDLLFGRQNKQQNNTWTIQSLHNVS